MTPRYDDLSDPLPKKSSINLMTFYSTVYPIGDSSFETPALKYI